MRMALWLVIVAAVAGMVAALEGQDQPKTTTPEAVCTQASQPLDRPLTEFWDRQPSLKKAFDKDKADMKAWLATLKSAQFGDDYAGLVKMLRSENPRARIKAIRAIGVLQDLAGMPYLLEAREDKDKLVRDWALSALGDWIYILANSDNSAYQVYHTDNTRIQDLAPILPHFIETVLAAGDDPNTRASCFRAIGHLAGQKWRVLVKEASASRHPAVTHWASWAIEEMDKRAKASDAPSTRPAE